MKHGTFSLAIQDIRTISTMASFAHLVVALCIAYSACAAPIDDGGIDVTGQLKVSVRVKLTELLNRLSLKTEDNTPLSLGKIMRIFRYQAAGELHIRAYIRPNSKVCSLIYREESSHRLDIDCGERKWRIIRGPMSRRKRSPDGEDEDEVTAQSYTATGYRRRDVLEDELSDLSLKINNILVQLESEQGVNFAVARIVKAKWQIEPDPRFLVTVEFVAPPTENIICNLEIREHPDSSYQDTTIECDQHTYIVTRGAGKIDERRLIIVDEIESGSTV